MVEIVVVVAALFVAGAVLLFAAKLGLAAIACILVLAFAFPDQFGNLPSMLLDLAGRVGDLDWTGMWSDFLNWIDRLPPIGRDLLDDARSGPNLQPAPDPPPAREPGEIRVIE